MRSAYSWTACVLGAIALVSFGWWWAEERRYRREIEQVRKDMAVGRLRVARQRLAELTKQRPGSSEVAYELGRCEDALGHSEAALLAWSRVAAVSAFHVKAGVGRAWLFINSGRLTQAEEVLDALPRDRSADAPQVRQAHEYLLRLEGRTQEARALIVTSWQGAPDPSYVLKRLYILEDAAFPLDHVKNALRAGARDDDRVWLGLANLAVWQGRFDEAARRLDACAERRPLDQAVWLARLSLATATRDIAGARRAAEHVLAAWFLPFELLRLRAWFASFGSDRAAERQSLHALLAEEPGNATAWARLVELALQSGHNADAKTARKRQAASTDLRERYTAILMGDDRTARAAELARLAQELGRPIEARGWSLIRDGRAARELLWPEGAVAARSATGGGESSEMLEESVRDLLGAATEHVAAAAPKPPSSFRLSRMTHRKPVCASFTTTAMPARNIRRPRRCAEALDCSTSTATAGSTSTRCRQAPSRRRGRQPARATVSSATAATARSLM
jgi:predicted Zn-dependent protease